MATPIQTARPAVAAAGIDRTVRNSFILLAMVLAVAAGGAGLGLAMDIGWGIGMWIAFMVVFIGGPFAIRAASGQAAIGICFAWAALVGFLLSPLVSAYLAIPGGSQIVLNALGTTAVLFVALAGYAVVSRRDFSFMGGFLMAGLIVLLLAIVANLFLQMPLLSVTISAAAVLLMSGLILFDVSRLVHEGARDAVMIVASLFASIVVLFTHLLNLFSLLGGED